MALNLIQSVLLKVPQILGLSAEEVRAVAQVLQSADLPALSKRSKPDKRIEAAADSTILLHGAGAPCSAPASLDEGPHETQSDESDDWKLDAELADLHSVAGLKLAAGKSFHPGSCFVFVDNSNTWAEGKKALAEKHGFESREDCRFRLCGDMMLDVFGASRTVQDRQVQHAALYGSYAHSDEGQYDGGWKQLESTGFQVVRYQRSTWSHKEKQVDSQMVADITALACEIDALGQAENCTFIVVSGDGDLLPAIERALQRGIKVEVWSWQRCCSNKLRRLHETGRAEFIPLDNHVDEIGFVDEVWNTKRWRVEDFADSSVVVKGVDAGDIADTCRAGLKCEWWYSMMADDSDDVVIILRPSTVNKEQWLDLLCTKLFADNDSAKVCRYPEYASNDAQQPMLRTESALSRSESTLRAASLSGNRWGVLGLEGSDTESDSEDESDDDELSHTSTPVCDDQEFQSSWRKPIKQAPTRPDCRHGYRCARGSTCSFVHTDDQKAFFEKHGGHCPRGYKLKQCSHAPSGRCKFSATPEWCLYAHGETDAYCMSCQCTGHSTVKCPGGASRLQAAYDKP